MSADTNSRPEMPEPQQIASETGELDAEQLDEVVGGGGLSSGGCVALPPPVG
jgi:hypothetical protein